MKKSFFSKTGITLAAVFAAVSISTMAYSQTVTVSATQTANGTTVFNNLQDAINSFAVAGVNHGNAAPDIINVRADQGPIFGKVIALKADSSFGTQPPPVNLVLEENLTIQGVDAGGNPSLAVFATSFATNTEQTLRNNGFPAFVWHQSVDLTVKNIAFIPKDISMVPANMTTAFMIVRAAAEPKNVVVNVEDCVFTANNGSDQPITITGRPEDDDKINDPNTILMPQGSSAIMSFSRQERGDMVLNFKNSVVASTTAKFSSGTRFEAFKAWMSGTPQDIITHRVNILEGSVFANLDGNVIQNNWASFVSIKGTAEKPVIIRKLTRAGAPAAIWNAFQISVNQPSACEIDYARFYDIACVMVMEGRGGITGYSSARSWVNSVKNTVFANGLSDALILASESNFDSTGIATSEITIDKTVFHSVGSGGTPSGIYAYDTLTRNLNVTNSYFTDSDANSFALTNTSPNTNWTVTNSILSTNGSSALAGQIAGSESGKINLDPTVTDVEVTYLNTTDPFHPDFFKIAGSDVRDWSVY